MNKAHDAHKAMLAARTAAAERARELAAQQREEGRAAAAREKENERLRAEHRVQKLTNAGAAALLTFNSEWLPAIQAAAQRGATKVDIVVLSDQASAASNYFSRLKARERYGNYPWDEHVFMRGHRNLGYGDKFLDEFDQRYIQEAIKLLRSEGFGVKLMRESRRINIVQGEDYNFKYETGVLRIEWSSK